MPTNMGWSIIGAAIIIGAFISSGLYSVVPVGQGERPSYTIIVNRFTGVARYCVPSECRFIPTIESPAAQP